MIRSGDLSRLLCNTLSLVNLFKVVDMSKQLDSTLMIAFVLFHKQINRDLAFYFLWSKYESMLRYTPTNVNLSYYKYELTPKHISVNVEYLPDDYPTTTDKIISKQQAHKERYSSTIGTNSSLLEQNPFS